MNIKTALLFIFAAAQLSAATIGWVAQESRPTDHTVFEYTVPDPDYSHFLLETIYPLYQQYDSWVQRGHPEEAVWYSAFDCQCTVYTPPSVTFPPGQNPGSATPEPATFALVGLALGLAAAFQVAARKLEKRYRVACVQCDGDAKFVGVIDGVYGDGPVCGACRDGGGA